MDMLIKDIRHGLRALRRNPGPTLAIVVSLSLAIGANAAIFTFLNTILLRPLPFSEAEEVVRIRDARVEEGGEPEQMAVSPFNYTSWMETSEAFEGFAAQENLTINLTGVTPPQRLQGSMVTGNFFRVLGIQPALGRDFLPDEDRPDNTANVALISHDLWNQLFEGSRDALGREVTLNQEKYSVIGVLPPKVQFPYRAQVWIPMGLSQSDQDTWHRHALNVFGRLQDGVSLDEARTEMEGIAARLAQEHPETNREWSVHLTGIREDLTGEVRPGLLALTVAAALVLLLACVNASNLLMARSLDQGSELAVRVALGAKRRDIVRQFLAQSLTLGLVAGLLGLVVAKVTLDGLVGLSPIRDLDPFFEQSLGLDFRVLSVTFAVSLLVGLVFGLLPAFKASRTDVRDFLSEGSTKSSRGLEGRRALGAFVVCEVAFAMLLLAGAGLILKSFQQAQEVELGFDEENLLTAQISLPQSKYPERSQRVAFLDRLVERLDALPEVAAAGVTLTHPYSDSRTVAPYVVENDPDLEPGEFYYANHAMVSPGYFRLMEIPLLEGRRFTGRDRIGAQEVVIVSESFAETHWPDGSALGKRVRVNREGWPWLTIVGVVGDTNEQSDYQDTWYVPIHQEWRFRAVTVIARTNVPPANVMNPLRQTVWELDQDQPLYDVETMPRLVADALRQERFSALLYSLFGGLALILAMVGIYGVMSYSVRNRYHEFGIRMSLGAGPSYLQRSILRRALVLTVAGVVIGGVAALALTRFLGSLLNEVDPNDPLTFASVSVGLAAFGLLASYLPSRRINRVHPMNILKVQ